MQATLGPYLVTYQDNKLSIETHAKQQITNEVYEWVAHHMNLEHVKYCSAEKIVRFVNEELLEYLQNKDKAKETFSHVFTPGATETHEESFHKIREFFRKYL